MKRRRAPRGLRPEERALWNQIAGTTRPLHPTPGPDRPVSAFGKAPASPDPAAAPDPAPTPPPIVPFRIGALAPTAGTPSSQSANPPLRMEARAFARLKRGRMAPEASIDLHGLNRAQALAALQRFVMTSRAQGMRLVLVITGKGEGRQRHDPFLGPGGALRREVPLWLEQAPLAQAVNQVTTAHPRHGGDGALYVWLRRTRERQSAPAGPRQTSP